MKAIIIGTPGKGKTTLTKRLKESFPDTHIVSIGGIRTPLGIHEPHKGYETEVSPENTSFLYAVLDKALDAYENIILEGYGLSPKDAWSLGDKYRCPVILLCHKDTTALKDFELVRKYDAPDKWTNNRTDEYLQKLYKFYKEVENKWIKEFPKAYTFDTSIDFENTIQQAETFIKEKNSEINK